MHDEMAGPPEDSGAYILVMWLDPDGLPRAYAVGVEPDTVEERAEQELAAYLKEQRLGYRREDFTRRAERIPYEEVR